MASGRKCVPIWTIFSGAWFWIKTSQCSKFHQNIFKITACTWNIGKRDGQTSLWSQVLLPLVIQGINSIQALQQLKKGYWNPSPLMLNRVYAQNRKILEHEKATFQICIVFYFHLNKNISMLLAFMALTNFHELKFKLHLQPPYSADLAKSDYYLFASREKCIRTKVFF